MHRIRALDGLRALAIILVIAYHVDRDVVEAGFWGVLLFFVLSGYLITRVLVVEADRDGSIRLGSFYLNRALRLLPALVVVCLAALVATDTAWSSVVPVLGQYANYARIADVELGLLTHTWFLAALAHCYLVWPIVVVLVPSRHRVRVIASLTIAAVVWRVVAIWIMSPAWVYNATDTNAAAFLIGCWLAVSRPRPWRHSGWSIPVFVVLSFFPVFGDRGSAVLWGGFVAIALSAVIVHHALDEPAWLGHRIPVWIGTISYGLYLWHYLFVRSDIPTWLALVLSVAVAVPSWYLLERPLQRLRRRTQIRPVGTPPT